MKTKLMTLLGASLLLVSCDSPSSRLGAVQSSSPGAEVVKLPDDNENTFIVRKEDGSVLYVRTSPANNQESTVYSAVEILPAQKPLPVEGH